MTSERRFDGPLLAGALSRARDVLARTLPPTSAGYRLFWVVGRDVGWLDLPAGGAYAILGSHEHCDAVLRGDSRVALRHLLATTIELADGLALRLLDLQTGVPFYLEDGRLVDRFVACGPVVAQLGRIVIGALPARPGELDLPDAPPHIAVEDSQELPRSVVPPPTLFPRGGGPRAVSYVASLPPASSIAALSRPDMREAIPRVESAVVEVPRPRPAVAGSPYRALEEDPAAGPACARVTLRQGELEASVGLDRGSLEVGVLIGRLPSCHDAKLLAVLNSGISRGHVLLFRHHDGCELFDLCSTQGTWQANRRVRRVRLEAGGTELTLATNEPVALAWSGG